MEKTNIQKLYEMAKASLGRSMVSPDVPIAYGCASSICNVLKKAGFDIGYTDSTKQLNKILLNSPLFKRSDAPQVGSIVNYPTGSSSIYPNGHVLINAKYGMLANNSYTGIWSEDYTLESARKHFQEAEGFEEFIFDLI